MGQIDFEGKNDATQDVRYGFISAKISDASDGTEDGQLRFFTIANGTETQTMTLESGNATFSGSVTADGLNVEIADNAASPVTMQQGGNSYFKIVTTNTSESVQLGNTTTNPDILLGGGSVGIGTSNPSSYYANHLVVNTGSSAQSGITIVSDTTVMVCSRLQMEQVGMPDSAVVTLTITTLMILGFGCRKH